MSVAMVEGVGKVVASFDAFEAGVAADCRAIVRASIARVYTAAKRACPYGVDEGPFPGHLRDQIRWQLSRDFPQGAVWVERRGIGGFYGTDNVGLWVEYGTAGHAMSRRGGWQKPIGPRPFMRPAVEQERPGFDAALRAAVERQVSQF